MEREVLVGADWSSFRPRVVVMEATVPKSDEPAHEAWEPVLLDAGYRLALFDGLNRFYAHADEPALLQALASPANVFDDFVPYAWTRQVDQAQQWAHSLEEKLTRTEHERDDLYENVARAHKTARDAQAQAATADESTAGAIADLHRVRAELHALSATRTFRYTAPLRNIAATLRRRSS
jgi:septal ring factor EnvC (AmiA/AmiB activator)